MTAPPTSHETLQALRAKCAAGAPVRVLGIESSCDETAAAVVTGVLPKDGAIRGPGEILSNVVHAQLKDHAAYGGVVPEIAARAHIEKIETVIAEAVAGVPGGWDGIDAIAATAGPGLIGGVIVGLMSAKGLALATGKPFVAVNHLAAHALSPRLIADVPFPYLLLLISGGHCQVLAVESPVRFKRLGTTIDDAVGEAFDKTAKLLGLGYPGGPAVERAAASGDAGRFALPRPMLGRPGADFSFSGLKTAVRHGMESLPAVTQKDIADMAASFQTAVAESLVGRTGDALGLFQERYNRLPSALVVAGGVAANMAIRRRLDDLAQNTQIPLIAPPPALCTDNGAMIAWAGLERLALGETDSLAVEARPRWPLDPTAEAMEPLAGAKGRKS